MNTFVKNSPRAPWTLALRAALSAALVSALGAPLVLPGCGDLAKSNCVGICEDKKQQSCGASLPAGTDCEQHCQDQRDEADEIGCLGAYEDVLLQCETDSCGEIDGSCEEAGEFLGCYLEGCKKNPDAAACNLGQ